MFFIKKLSKSEQKWAIFSLFFCFLIILIILSNTALAEIINPSDQAPNRNTSGFIQISNIDQAKQGPLRLGTNDVASVFNYQLEVLGEGAEISNTIIENDLVISDTVLNNKQILMVDSENQKVCIGDCLGVENSKLEVSGRGILANNVENSGNALSVYSDSQEAIYGSGSLGGIYSLASGDNYAIYGLSTTGTAVEGRNLSGNYSALAGFSENGIGIYGTNLNLLGLWSAYFDGRLETHDDISGAKLISRNYPDSLVGFTFGQIMDNFNFGDSQAIYHDGTYIWLVSGDKIMKIRGSDGFKIYEATIGDGISSMIYDDSYYWITHETGVSKIDPVDGGIVCSIALADAKSIAFTGQNYWVTENGTGELVNINSSCTQIGASIALVDATNFNLGKIIYNESFLWVLSQNIDTGAGAVININPSTHDAIRWDRLVGTYPVDIYFDNYYYWVLNSGLGSVSRFYLQENKVCTELDASNNPYYCNIDSDCNDVGLGTCGFEAPQSFGSYYLSYDSNRLNNTPTNFIFNKQDIWINNNWTDSGSNNYSELVKMSLADPNQAESFALAGTTNSIVYDQSYLWVSSSDADLVKINSGVGYGHIDMTDTVALQNNNPLVPQRGSFSIDGDAKVGTDVNSEGDLSADNSSWGERGTGDYIFNDEAMVWTTGGSLPDGGNGVNALIEASDGTLYLGAGTAPGSTVYSSTDGGQTWVNTGGPYQVNYVYSLMQSSDGYIYAGSGAGTFGAISRYNPSTGVWVTLRTFVGDGVVMSLLEGSNGYLYAGNGIFGAYVYRSVDGGTTWNTTGALAGSSQVSDLIESPSGQIFAATGGPNGDVFMTTNYGANWNNTGNLNSATTVYDLLWTSDDLLYAGVFTGTGGNVIFRSGDSGATWNLVTPFPVNMTRINTLVEAPDGSIYAGGSGVADPPHNIYRSIDGGATWLAVPGTMVNTSIRDLVSVGDDLRFYVFAVNGTPTSFEGAFNKLDPGVYNCPVGHYIINIAKNLLGEVVLIECRPL